MKGILASPVVIVTLWCLVVALHHPTESSIKTHKYGAGNSGMKQQQNPRSLQLQQLDNAMQEAQRSKGTKTTKDHSNRIPVYVPLGQQQQQFTTGLQANGMQAAPQLMMPQQQSNLAAQNGYNMQLQGGYSQEQPQMMMMPQNNMMSGQNMMQLSQQQPGQMYQQQQQLPQQMMMQGQPQMMQGQPQMVMAAPNQLQQGQPQLMQQQRGQMMQSYENQQPALTSTARVQSQKPAHPNKLMNFLRGKKANNAYEKPHHQPLGQQPQVYYYDPAQTVVNGNQFQPPSVVYDQHGNEVPLASLTSTGNNEVHMEAPPATLVDAPHYGSTSNINNNNQRHLLLSSSSTLSNTTNSTGPILLPPPLEMNIKTPESWGESTSQDQSIIVCTVAVMALLVGALSARRLRAKSFLSSCIENEALDNEVAFDNATTFSGGDSYNTFGWKGDLEKFDV